jgi:hypothetical protein
MATPKGTWVAQIWMGRRFCRIQWHGTNYGACFTSHPKASKNCNNLHNLLTHFDHYFQYTRIRAMSQWSDINLKFPYHSNSRNYYQLSQLLPVVATTTNCRNYYQLSQLLPIVATTTNCRNYYQLSQLLTNKNVLDRIQRTFMSRTRL